MHAGRRYHACGSEMEEGIAFIAEAFLIDPRSECHRDSRREPLHVYTSASRRRGAAIPHDGRLNTAPRTDWETNGMRALHE